MASITVGRTNCPVNCGHTAAQVKLKTDKGEGKTAFPYVHCAGCGVQLHTKNAEQAAHLAKISRPVEGAAAPQPGADAPGGAPGAKQEPADTNTPPAPAKASGGFLGGFGLSGWN